MCICPYRLQWSAFCQRLCLVLSTDLALYKFVFVFVVSVILVVGCCPWHVLLGVSSMVCILSVSMIRIVGRLFNGLHSVSVHDACCWASRVETSSSCWAARQVGVVSTSSEPIVSWCLTRTGIRPMMTRQWRACGVTDRRNSATSTDSLRSLVVSLSSHTLQTHWVHSSVLGLCWKHVKLVAFNTR